MSASKIELLIEEIYDYVESCKSSTFNSNKVVVPKEPLYDLLDELHLRLPDEIKRYQKIIANRDAILNDAKTKADTMLAQAEEETRRIIDESQIMQQAYDQANQIVEQAAAEAAKMLRDAGEEANQVRSSAIYYTNDLLTDAEYAIRNAYDSTKSKYEVLMEAMRGNLDIIANNKKELAQSENPEPVEEAAVAQEVVEEQAVEVKDDFDFDEDAFLEQLDQQ